MLVLRNDGALLLEGHLFVVASIYGELVQEVILMHDTVTYIISRSSSNICILNCMWQYNVYACMYLHTCLVSTYYLLIFLITSYNYGCQYS